jgi:dipeptidyl-peptidase 4
MQPYKLLLALLLTSLLVKGQNSFIQWAKEGNSYYKYEGGDIVRYTLPKQERSVVVSKDKLKPAGAATPLNIRAFSFSANEQKMLIYTNTKKVWRFDTRGDYWCYDLSTGSLQLLGKSLPTSSLMFAKFSPDGLHAAYVSHYNLYVENLATHTIKALTTNGTREIINGTFDWAYEEEFNCRDGFRWAPNSQQIAYWQINDNHTKNYLMLNNTDSIYPTAVPVEYPIAGELPSAYKIGVVDIGSATTKWMSIPTDTIWQTYLPRMEWGYNSKELIVQQLNRKQNLSTLMLCNASTGTATSIYTEKDAAWIDVVSAWDDSYKQGGWDWLNEGKSFLWASEKDGWRHLYLLSKNGKKETLITKGNYDVIDIVNINEKNNYVYFMASPTNATQSYLYRTKLDGTSQQPERLTPAQQPGMHDYNLSPNSNFAEHTFSNHCTPPVKEWIALPTHQSTVGKSKVEEALAKADKKASNIEFLSIKTTEGTSMDAWMVKPINFNPAKKYPVVFFVYTEPAKQTVVDAYGASYNFLYAGDMAADGYIYISIDNRGTPSPKGAQWRKCIYKKIGRLNIADQASAVKEVLKWPFIDSTRTAVWGWSGGGAATLNLMFQYPTLFKTGIAIAAVGNQLTYDNIYQERYMGLPQENREDFVKGSPITYAKSLAGNLLYIHGTGDDNVHFNNAEMLINELVKYNKQFQLMTYPNRTHSLSEGEGTFQHLTRLYTQFLNEHCLPGGR